MENRRKRTCVAEITRRRVGCNKNGATAESTSSSRKMSILSALTAESTIVLPSVTPSWLWLLEIHLFFFIGRWVVEAWELTLADLTYHAGHHIAFKTWSLVLLFDFIHMTWYFQRFDSSLTSYIHITHTIHKNNSNFSWLTHFLTNLPRNTN